MKKVDAQAIEKGAAGSHAERFSVSIPDYLYEWGERKRTELNLNRSEFVACLYQRFMDEVEFQERRERYVAAYAREPETAAEQALSEAFIGSSGD